jgi:bifunctional DNA-binding transcriptional regulator/antitoxin component of YhaV-PrlF toxin-antitoxin module
VIPVAVRRRLGLKTGQPLAIRANTQDEIVRRPADRGSDARGRNAPAAPRRRPEAAERK